MKYGREMIDEHSRGTGEGAETQRIRRIFEDFAPRYDKEIAFWERVLFAGGREWVCSRASGDVLELGIGTGRNLSLYPPEARLTGIDFSPAMLAIARARTVELQRPADLREGDAQDLEFADASFDTITCTLVL